MPNPELVAGEVDLQTPKTFKFSLRINGWIVIESFIHKREYTELNWTMHIPATPSLSPNGWFVGFIRRERITVKPIACVYLSSVPTSCQQPLR